MSPQPGAQPDGPLYHGGRARLVPGRLLRPGQRPNPWGDTFDDNGRSVYIYCTTRLDTAQSYAEAVRQQTGRQARVYEVKPTGPLLADCNAQDYRSRYPLEIVRRVD